MDITLKQGANTGVIDPALIGPSNPYEPEVHSAIADLVSDEITFDPITPVSTSTWPTKISFELRKAMDRLEKAWFEFGTSAITTTGGTYRRFCDLVGYEMIDHIDIISNNQTPQTIYPPYDCLYRYYKENDFVQRTTVEAGFVGGDLTAAQRNTKALAAQTFRIPIHAWWQEVKGHAVIMPGLASPLRIEIYLKPLDQIVQTDGTAPVCTFTTSPSTILRCKVKHCDQGTRARWVGLTQTDVGLSRMHEIVQTQLGTAILANATDSGNIQLPNLTGPCSRLVIFVRPTASVGTALSRIPTDFRQSLLPTTIEWKVGNSDIWHQMPVADWLVRAYSCESGRYDGPYVPIIEIPFDEAPQLKNTATGHLNLQNLTNHTFRLRWDAPGVTEAVTVDFISFCKNWVQEQGGRVSQVFRL